MPRNHWLLKTEPEAYSLADLERAPETTACWDGVRNYQARNLLRDEFRLGDRALFYHSQTTAPSIVAVVRVARTGYPDPTQFDARSERFDGKATRDAPRWYAVDVKLERKLAHPVTRATLRATPGLERMELLRPGSRLSVQRVTEAEWALIAGLGGF